MYQKENLLGSGQFGKVSKYVDVHNPTNSIAEKVSKYGPGTNDETGNIAKFEYKVAERLGRTVGPMETDATKRKVRVPMQYIEGTNLAHANLSPAEKKQAKRIVLDRFDGMHAKGVYHGDAFSKNWLLQRTNSGRNIKDVVPVDFGMSTLAHGNGVLERASNMRNNLESTPEWKDLSLKEKDYAAFKYSMNRNDGRQNRNDFDGLSRAAEWAKRKALERVTGKKLPRPMRPAAAGAAAGEAAGEVAGNVTGGVAGGATGQLAGEVAGNPTDVAGAAEGVAAEEVIYQ
ncbi:hypothetical protein HDV03_005030 [Kappamyces sp. JEL0829]|nr:hypothetical protein HDV03_005030 [Kappamyces sp. JEL0829]